MPTFRREIVLLLTLFLFSSISSAEIIWNGFASVYGRESLTKNPLDVSADNRGKGINFSNDTKVGLNLRSNFAENWSAVGQMVVSRRSLTPANVGPQWAPQFDWFFVNYEDPTTGLSIKAGRQLFPASITAEYIDVGLAYPWRELPEQFKFALTFKSFEGVSANYAVDLADSRLSFRLLTGNDDSGEPTRNSFGYYGFEVNDLYGIQTAVEGDGWKVQATYSVFKLSTTFLSYSTPPVPTTLVTVEGGMDQIFILGGRYDRDNVLVYAEYLQACVAEDPVCRAKSYYGTLGYHLGKFLPHYTYAFGDWKLPGFAVGEETSHGFGLNYQVNSNVLLKSEYLIQEDKNGPVFLTSVGKAESVAVGINVVF